MVLSLSFISQLSTSNHLQKGEKLAKGLNKLEGKVSINLLLYIANRLRQKSFADGQASANSLENFCGLPSPLILKTKCAHMRKQLSIIHMRCQVSP